MNNLTQESLKTIITYDRDTGVLRWIGGQKADFEAGTLRPNGYRRIRVLGSYYYAHRLAWLYEFGSNPNGQIDHLNGVRNDNRIINLRDVSAATNRENIRIAYASNKTGFLGVSPTKGKFKAQIKIGEKVVHIGVYTNPQDAHEAYKKRKRELHFGCTI